MGVRFPLRVLIAATKKEGTKDVQDKLMKDISIYSFSFLFGEDKLDKIKNCGVVLDCRNLPDPEGLGIGPNGTDSDVQHFIFTKSNGDATAMLLKCIEGFRCGVTSFAFGCYAGKNRSVAMAEVLSAAVTAFGYSPSIEHISLNKRWL